MRIEATPMLQLGDYTILQERTEVLFRDDSTIGLHQVMRAGVPALFLRCLVQDELHALVFDLRDLCHSLGAELPVCPARDVQGVVFMTLRLKYASAAEFRGAVIGVVKAAALLPAREQLQLFRPAPTQGVRIDGRAYV